MPDVYDDLHGGQFLVHEGSRFYSDPRRLPHNRTVTYARGRGFWDVRESGVALMRMVLATDRYIAACSWPDGYASPAMGEILHGIGYLLSADCGDLIPGVIEHWRCLAAERVGWDLDLHEVRGLKAPRP